MITGDNASNSGVAGSDEAFKFNLSSLRLEGSYFVQPLFRVERMIDPKKIWMLSTTNPSVNDLLNTHPTYIKWES